MHSCIYFRGLEDQFFIYLLLYDDDTLIVAKTMLDINVSERQLNAKFEMKYIGYGNFA